MSPSPTAIGPLAGLIPFALTVALWAAAKYAIPRIGGSPVEPWGTVLGLGAGALGLALIFSTGPVSLGGAWAANVAFDTDAAVAAAAGEE